MLTHVCLSVHRRVPRSGPARGYPHPAFYRRTSIQPWTEGTPSLDGGYPPARSEGVPLARSNGDTPVRSNRGVPWPGLTWGTPARSDGGTLARGTPSKDGVPPCPRLDGGTPYLRLDGGTPWSRTYRWSTWYLICCSQYASCIHAGGLSC